VPIAITHRRTILSLWLLLIALCALIISRTPFTADLSAFLPAHPTAQQQVLMTHVQSGWASRMVLVGIEGGEAAQRAQASRQLAQGLRQGGLFDQVQNGDPAGFKAIGEWIFQNRYRLSPANTLDRYNAKGLQEAIADTLSLLGTPAGSAFKPLLNRDPTGETLRIAEAMIPAQTPHTESGVWAAKPQNNKKPRALLLLSTKAEGGDWDAQARAIAHIHHTFESLQAKGFRLQISGPGVMAVQSRAQIEREVQWLSIAGLLAMGVLLGAVLGSFRALLLAALPVLSGVLAGIAAVGVGFGGVHGITLGFGSTLIGEAVDYAIYYLIQAGRRRDSSDKTAPGHTSEHPAWLAKSWPTVRLGLLTSLCGFAALAFSGFPGLAQLGVFSVAGLLAAAFTTRYVLPVFNQKPLRNTLVKRALSQFADYLFLKCQSNQNKKHTLWRHINLKNISLILSLAATIVIIQQKESIWRGDLSNLSPVPATALKLDAELRADLSTSDAASLVLVQEPNEERALRTVEVLTHTLDTWVEQGLIAGYDSPTRWLPSLYTQKQRLQNLPDEATLREHLAQASQGSALPASRLAPFIEDVKQARKAVPITRESLDKTAVAPLIDALLLRQKTSVTAFVPLHAPVGPSHINTVDLQNRLQKLSATSHGLQTVQLLKVKQELDNLYAHYLNEAIVQAVVGGAAVLLLLLAWLKSIKRWARVCWPLLLALVLTLGGLVFLQIPLGVLHLVGLLLVLALGSNYALFFDQLAQGSSATSDEHSDTLASLLLANLTTVISFGLIAFSQIPALSALGRVVAPGALLALCLAAAWVPADHPQKLTAPSP
jgi:predicted exporter